MKLFLLAISLYLSSGSPVLSHQISCIILADEHAAVKESFAKFKAAVLAMDGKEAVKYVDKHTVDYYGRMLKLVLNADSATVNNLPAIDKITVFASRHLAKRSEIKDLDGAGFFAYSITKGMVDKGTYEDMSLGEVKMQTDSAQAQMVNSGKAMPVYFKYYKQNSLWKLDMTSLFPIASMGMRYMITQSGMTENAFIFNLLEIQTGRAPGAEIWKPLK